MTPSLKHLRAVQDFDPDDPALVLVADEAHPLFDERALTVVEEGDPHVQNILRLGVIEPIIVRQRGNQWEVVDGRKRVIWSRAANRILRKRGRPTRRVEAIVKDVADPAALEVQVSTNEIREGDSLVGRARKAARLRSLGRSVKEIAVTFGVTQPAVQMWLHLVELPEPVQQAVVAGQLRLYDAAWVYTKMATEEEQLAALEAHLKRKAARPKGNGHAGKGGVPSPSPGQRRMTIRVRMLGRFMASAPFHVFAGIDPSEVGMSIVAWELGEISDHEFARRIPPCEVMFKPALRQHQPAQPSA